MELEAQGKLPPVSQISVQRGEKVRQERRQKVHSSSAHFTLNKSFPLVLQSCQHLIIRLNEHA